MAPIVKLKITFDDPRGVVECGRAITGHVHVIVEEKDGAKIRGVKIEWKGEGKTHFRSGGNQYTKTETYVENDMYIMGSSDRSRACISLQEGSHAIPFSVFIPPNVPGSFEHDKGEISYYIYAKINFPYNLFDPNSTLYFKVTRPSVLLGNTLNPRQANLEYRVGFCCISKGEVSGTLGLQRSGFLPGEEMRFSLRIDNDSSKEVLRTEVSLVQYTHFNGTRRSNPKNKKTNAPLHKDLKVSRTWETLTFPSVNPQSNFESGDNTLILDSKLVPSDAFECCSLMRINYELVIRLVFEWPYPNKSQSIPIIIGSSYERRAPPFPVVSGPNLFIQSNVPPYPLPGGYPVPYVPQAPQGYRPIPQYPESAGSFPPDNVNPSAPIGPYSPPPPYNPLPPDFKN